jgi:hypothetical protein
MAGTILAPLSTPHETIKRLIAAGWPKRIGLKQQD